MHDPVGPAGASAAAGSGPLSGGQSTLAPLEASEADGELIGSARFPLAKPALQRPSGTSCCQDSGWLRALGPKGSPGERPPGWVIGQYPKGAPEEQAAKMTRGPHSHGELAWLGPCPKSHRDPVSSSVQ